MCNVTKVESLCAIHSSGPEQWKVDFVNVNKCCGTSMWTRGANI